MEVVSADSNGVVGIHPQQPELGATWQIHFKMACVFLLLSGIPCFQQFCKLFLTWPFLTEEICSVINFLTPNMVLGVAGAAVWRQMVVRGCAR